jgi:hypothetical protein
MSEAKPIAKLMDTCLKNNPWQEPTDNKLEHIDYRPPQWILCPCTGGKEKCVDLEFWVSSIV